MLMKFLFPAGGLESEGEGGGGGGGGKTVKLQTKAITEFTYTTYRHIVFFTIYISKQGTKGHNSSSDDFFR